jgi:hypothetical protein
MKKGLNKKVISEENKKSLRKLEEELSFKSRNSNFNPNRIIKGYYPFYFLNKKVLNPYIIESIDKMFDEYKPKQSGMGSSQSVNSASQ